MLLNQATHQPQTPNRRPYLLLLIVAIILLGIAMTSCKTCEECPTLKQETRIKDSLAIRFKDSIRWHDAKEGPTSNVDFGGDCDSIRKVLAAIQKNPIVKKKNGITSTISSQDGKSLQFNCNEDAYKDTLKNAIIERDFWHFEYEHKETAKPCDKEHKTGWNTMCTWFFWITVLLITVIGYLKIKGWLANLNKVMP